VLSPDHLVWLRNEDTAYGIGYMSYIHYKIQDQFYVTLGPSVPVNESWISAHTSDYSGETWPQPLTHNGTVNPADWSDSVGAWGTDYYPAPQNPQSPLGNIRVHHWGQQWRVGTLTGGAGKAVQDDVLQYYRDHGRAE
jgi:hypothetical protein